MFSVICGMLGFGAIAKAEDEFPASERFKLLYQRLHRAEEDASRREVSLAGCSMAATGGTSPESVCTQDQWAWHPAYEDVLCLRRKFEAAIRIIEERMPSGQTVVLYVCGCSAVGTNQIPRYCPEHGSPTRVAECTLITAPKRERPTIAELEDILARQEQPKVTILRDGSVIAI